MRAEPLPEVLETRRLILRQHRTTDTDDVFAYANDAVWARYLPGVPIPYSRHDAERFISSQLLLDRRVHASWAIVLQGTVIGGINLRFVVEQRVAEMGYSVARAHWTKGYATEAARAVLAAAFEGYPGLQRIRASADLRNTASQRVLRKIGMIREGVLRSNRLLRDELVDEAWFGILRSEWAG